MIFIITRSNTQKFTIFTCGKQPTSNYNCGNQIFKLTTQFLELGDKEKDCKAFPALRVC